MTDFIREATLLAIETLDIPQHDAGSGQTSIQHLRWMQNELLRGKTLFSTDKLNRWLGFMQGVLAAQGYLDVNTERTRTRPMFYGAYEKTKSTIKDEQ